MNLITLKNINKRYGTNHVIKSLDCTISKNKIFGLLGPNGAGKTTLMLVKSLPKKMFERSDICPRNEGYIST